MENSDPIQLPEHAELDILGPLVIHATTISLNMFEDEPIWMEWSAARAMLSEFDGTTESDRRNGLREVLGETLSTYSVTNEEIDMFAPMPLPPIALTAGIKQEIHDHMFALSHYPSVMGALMDTFTAASIDIRSLSVEDMRGHLLKALDQYIQRAIEKSKERAS